MTAAAVYKMRFQPRQRKRKEGKKPEPVDNPVFFNKTQVKTGTLLQSYGVLSRDTHWVVEKIVTYQLTAVGSYRPKVVQMVEKLSDDVYLRCTETNERRTMQFANLRYGAHWWLASAKII